MNTQIAALVILDIYEVHDRVVGREENKPLFPVFYEDDQGNKNKWWFLEEHIKDIYLFIKSLIDLGIIKGRVITVIDPQGGVK